MGIVRRIFVEKKPDYAVKAKELHSEIDSYLGIGSVTNVRVLIRYDIEDISPETYQMALGTVFSEPPVDRLYEEDFPLQGAQMFGVEFLPGQFDQRADSAEQCIKLLNEEETPLIKTAVIYVFAGNIGEQQFTAIKAHCINPVDSRETDLLKPQTLASVFAEPEDIKIVEGLIQLKKESLVALYDSFHFAMTFQDFLHIQNYFAREEHRDPTMTELKVLDTYWSDHCRHTTFSTELKEIQFEDGYYKAPILAAYNDYKAAHEELFFGQSDKFICLMDLALLAMRRLKKEGLLADLEESEEINACSIVVPVEIDGITEEWLISFKNETHNHPTEIEPYGGAATCLGGAIRDPLSGRAYVYQAMRVTGAADPTVSVKNTLKGKLPQKKLVRGAANGYSSYGNQIGLATGYVKEIYHPNYVAKRMEIGAVIGAAPRKNVRRESSDPGDIIILLGGRTGRDGCGGATGSSKVHTEESIETCGAEVQKGNPPTERKIQRLFRREEVSRMIKKCNDFGAGGVCVAIGELADGLRIQLDAVPKKYAGLNGTEIAISESQERMAVVVDPKDVRKFLEYAKEENLEAVEVATVTKEERLVLIWRGKEIVNLSRAFLNTNGAHQETSVLVEMPIEAEVSDETPDETRTCSASMHKGQYAAKENYLTRISNQKVRMDLDKQDVKSAWLHMLEDLNVCSQKGLVEMFDSSIGASSVLMPYGGKYQLTETQSMVGKLPIIKGETDTVTMMSYGFDAYLSSWSPYHGAVYAVLESVARIVAAGGDYKKIRFTFQEYFCRMTDEKRWGQPVAALLGAYNAQMGFKLPAIGGKDSMSGTFQDIDVAPTLVSFAVDLAKHQDVITPELKKVGSKIGMLNIKKDDYDLPVYQQAMKLYETVHRLIQQGAIISAYALDAKGIVAAVSKMAFGNKLGVAINQDINAKLLFKPNIGSLLVEIPDGMVPAVEEAMKQVCLEGAQLEDMQERNACLEGAQLEDTRARNACLEGAQLEDMQERNACLEGPQLEDVYVEIGMVTGSETFVYGDLTIALDEALEAWLSPLENVFQTKSSRRAKDIGKGNDKAGEGNDTTGIYKTEQLYVCRHKVAQPTVFIPVFPGTNCEYDSLRAFERAGAHVVTKVFKNLTATDIRNSVDEFQKILEQTQILMFPGGFSAGDEPEGSAKFFATVFRNGKISDAVNHLLQDRDGLALGICNGFQALIKLGLVPYGILMPQREDAPTLTYNTIGRHISKMAYTKVVSNKSPWFLHAKLDTPYVSPVSHGEGRFVAPKECLEKLFENGQIATQYVNPQGDVTMDEEWNVNGSYMAIEGITSPDGRIFGKMAHSERIGTAVAKNIYGEQDLKLFESGVDYFR
ncbi:phosphoribosylformylglycinamidine synthase subunit PurQ [Lachnospiraceae bacterium ZAX-1]